MSVWDAHYDAIYASDMASAATLVTADGASHSITVMDKTAGVLVGDGVGVQTVIPACDVRMTELAAKGLTRPVVNGSMLTVNGSTRKVTHHELRPSPQGEDHGELRMFLTEVQS